MVAFWPAHFVVALSKATYFHDSFLHPEIQTSLSELSPGITIGFIALHVRKTLVYFKGYLLLLIERYS